LRQAAALDSFAGLGLRQLLDQILTAGPSAEADFAVTP